MSSPVTEGATALKLENEVHEETLNETEQSSINIEDTLMNNEALNENDSEDMNANSLIDEKVETASEPNISNGLENFEIEEESPELFSSDNIDVTEETLSENLNSSEEDDLEIPAFLRRQKN
jgi:cell division protein FtsZ